jgi:hypothetical protein
VHAARTGRHRHRGAGGRGQPGEPQHSPGVAARLRLDGGASSATIGNLTYTGVTDGTMLTMPGWASAPRRYDIDAPAGVSAISVTSR